MSLPEFDMRQLLESGVHFGHQTHRWNPKMEPFIFGSRNGIHIIDLTQTVPYLHRALQEMRGVVAKGGRVLFVGTKRQAGTHIAEAAKRSGQYFVNHRWLGGMLTNWRTISQSIKRLKSMDEQLGQEDLGLTKKETLELQRERDKLELSLGGIRDMGGLPDIMFIIDTNREVHAVREANRLGIPVVAVVDSNSDPDGITYPIPGNDDATRAIKLYCDLAALSVLDGIQAELEAQGVDIGSSEEPTEEVLIEAAQARNEGADMAKVAEPDEGEVTTARAKDAVTPAETAAMKPAEAESAKADDKAATAADKKSDSKVAATETTVPAKKESTGKTAGDKADEKTEEKTVEKKTASAKTPEKKTAKKPAAKKPASKKAADSKSAATKTKTASTAKKATSKSTTAAKKTSTTKKTTAAKKPAKSSSKATTKKSAGAKKAAASTSSKKSSAKTIGTKTEGKAASRKADEGK